MPIVGRYEIGELDQRVELQKFTRSPDGQGGFTETWTTEATVWAHVRPQTGREREFADRQTAEAGYLVVIRYRDDVDETWRFKWLNTGRLMNIRYVQQRGGRELYLPIEAERGVAT